MYPSILKSLTLATLAFSPTILASPLDPPTSDLEKRGGWTSKSTCPSGDGQEYDGPNGGAWIVRCGMDTVSSKNTGSTNTNTFIACIQACGARPDTCDRVTYTGDVNGPGACYFKQKSAGGLTASEGRKVATKLNG